MALPKTKKSGGPQSPEGKSASSGNALKTGAYSQQQLLPGESSSDFEELLGQFQHDFAPQDVAESAMVRDLAVLAWKQLRVEKMQHSILLTEMRRVVTPDDLKLYGWFQFPWERNELLQLVLEEDFEVQVRTQRNMVKLFERLTSPPTKDFIASLKKEVPDGYALIKEYFELENGSGGDFEEKLLNTDVTTDNKGSVVSYLQHYFDQAAEERKGLFWVDDHKGDILQAFQTVRAKRAMEFMQNANMARVTDDVQRAFYRTLGELRKHQTWRRSLMVVDITPAVNLAGGV